jgi:hypothetical protein
MPPLLNIPVPVSDLRAQQIGSRIRIEFSIPRLTSEGQIFRNLDRVELRLGEGGGGEFDANAWAAQARLVEGFATGNGTVTHEVPAAEWAGKEIILGARVHADNGRDSGWSNFVVLPVLPPVATPANLAAHAIPQGVRVTWSTQADSFRVFRRSPDEKDFVEVATVVTPEWVDAATEYGKRYEYRVQAAAKAGQGVALSEISPSISIVPADTFAPSVPTALRAVSSTGSIEFLWERSPEPDVASYRVYRTSGNQPWTQIGETAGAPAFSDREAARGMTWRYAVSALDRVGNESAKSEPVEVTY